MTALIALAVHHQRSLIDDDEYSPSPSSASISGSSAVFADSGSSKVSNSEDGNSEDNSNDNDEPGEDPLSGDEDLHRAESANSDQHGSVPGSQSPAPSVDDQSEWDVEPVAIAHPVLEQGPAHLHTSTPPPSSVRDNNAPSSPIEHVFARMAGQASAASIQSSMTPEADDPMEDYCNIDPQLLSQSRPRPEDSVLLDQGMEGFVYSPTPSSTSPAPSINKGPSTSTSPDLSAALLQIDVDYTIANARMGTAQGLDSPASQSASASVASDAADASNSSDAAVNAKSTSPPVDAKSTSPTVTKSTSPADANLSDAVEPTPASDSSNDHVPLEDLTLAQKRTRTIAAKKAAMAARATVDNKRPADDAEGDESSKRQKSVGTSVENGRPRCNVRQSCWVDESPKKK